MLKGRISAGNARTLASDVRNGRWSEVENWLRTVADQAAGKGCDRVLVSSEWLLDAFSGDNRLVEFSRRLNGLGDHSILLLLLLRDPVNQLISLYKHRAKAGTAGSIDEWVAGGYELPRKLKGIRQQQQASGVELFARSYGSQQGDLERLFFEEWLEMPVPADAAGLLVNPSLSLSELVLLRRLRACHPGLVACLYERLLAIDPGLKTEGKAMGEYARNVAINAVAVHADEWQHWNGVLSQSERLQIPQPGPEPGPEPDSLELSASQLGSVMQLLSEAATPGFVLRLYWSWRRRPVLSRLKWSMWPWRARR